MLFTCCLTLKITYGTGQAPALPRELPLCNTTTCFAQLISVYRLILSAQAFNTKTRAPSLPLQLQSIPFPSVHPFCTASTGSQSTPSLATKTPHAYSEFLIAAILVLACLQKTNKSRFASVLCNGKV